MAPSLPPSEASKPDRRATVVAAVVICVLGIVYVAGLLRDDPAPELGASVKEIQSHPDEVLGERWAIAAQVREVLGHQLILVGGPAFGVTPLPVVLTGPARDAAESGLGRGDVGQFVGQFRRLDVDRLERRLRADLPEERLHALEGKLVLVANRAAVDQRRG